MIFVIYKFIFRVKADLTTTKEMLAIGTGFQHAIDSCFWYLPFSNQRECKHVLEVMAEIPEDKWMAKRAEISAEHETEGTRDELRTGLKDWIGFPASFTSDSA